MLPELSERVAWTESPTFATTTQLFAFMTFTPVFQDANALVPAQGYSACRRSSQRILCVHPDHLKRRNGLVDKPIDLIRCWEMGRDGEVGRAAESARPYEDLDVGNCRGRLAWAAREMESKRAFSLFKPHGVVSPN
jgi:hypothetical protein